MLAIGGSGKGIDRNSLYYLCNPYLNLKPFKNKNFLNIFDLLDKREKDIPPISDQAHLAASSNNKNDVNCSPRASNWNHRGSQFTLDEWDA